MDLKFNFMETEQNYLYGLTVQGIQSYLTNKNIYILWK